jgi:hypothetical protein
MPANFTVLYDASVFYPAFLRDFLMELLAGVIVHPDQLLDPSHKENYG